MEATKQMYEMNKTHNRKGMIKPEPLFQDKFNCMMGEDQCPIKRENNEQKTELSLKEAEVHRQQREIEELRNSIKDKLADAAQDTEVLKSVAYDIEQSMAIKSRENTIKERDDTIRDLKVQMEQAENKVNVLLKERDDFMTTGYEADIKFADKFKNYQELIKKHDNLLAKVTSLEVKNNKVQMTIKENTAYQREVALEINKHISMLNDLDQQVARLRIEKRKLYKVKLVSDKTPGRIGRFFRRFKKDGSKSK